MDLLRIPTNFDAQAKSVTEHLSCYEGPLNWTDLEALAPAANDRNPPIL